MNSLAEPVAELHKGYEKFLHRFEQYRRRKSQVLQAKSVPNVVDPSRSIKSSLKNAGNSKHLEYEINEKKLEAVIDLPKAECFLKDKRQSLVPSDDTVVVKFVGSAITGKSEAEDASHHGLIDPTINTKEALNAISNMFKEPLEAESKVKRRVNHEQYKASHASSAFEVFVDDCEGHDNEDGCHGFGKNGGLANSARQRVQMETENHNLLFGTFHILADDDNENGSDNNDNEDDKKSDSHGCHGFGKNGLANSARPRVQMKTENHNLVNRTFHILADDDENGDDNNDIEDDNDEECNSHGNFVFCETMKEPNPKVVASHLIGDTIIQRFVGSTILSEPEVENAWHHGLVDPTINMKEAMDDINGMFGKPINFVKPRRTATTSKQPASSQQKQASQGFCILADDHDHGGMEEEKQLKTQSLVTSCIESDLFEPTIYTKEAMNEINSMFGNPLDF